MRIAWICILVSLFPLASQAQDRLCDKQKKGDFMDCVNFLKSTYATKSDDKAFTKQFDEICQTNSKFKCTKVTVMGDLDKTTQDYKKDPDWKGAQFFPVKSEDGKFLLIFQKK